MKNTVFFGEPGITSTSANHLCNLATKLIESKMSSIEDIGFIDKVLELPTKESTVTLQKGADEESLKTIPDILNAVSQFVAFVTYVREAIKAKECEMQNITKLSLEEYCEMTGKDYPSTPNYSLATEDFVIETMSIKERTRYYVLQAKASTLGKSIHKGSFLDNARKDLLKALSNPAKCMDKSGEVTLEFIRPTMTQDRFDDIFFQLQKEHRETERELNSIKFSIKERVRELNLTLKAEYDKDNAEYLNFYNTLLNDLKKYKDEETRNVSNLKIIIPSELEAVFNYLNTL